MSDEVERRLRAADPLRRVPPETAPSDQWFQDLVEASMTTPVAARDAARPRRRTLLAAAAATAAVAALGTGGYALLRGGADPAGGPDPALTLALPAGDSMQSCVQFSVPVLAQMPVAFAGTVRDVGEGSVVLDVDRWYRGGDAGAVELESPDPGTAALLGSVEFAEGERYLVTATGGVVNSCGFTAQWSPQTAAAFEEAFAG